MTDQGRPVPPHGSGGGQIVEPFTMEPPGAAATLALRLERDWAYSPFCLQAAQTLRAQADAISALQGALLKIATFEPFPGEGDAHTQIATFSKKVARGAVAKATGEA